MIYSKFLLTLATSLLLMSCGKEASSEGAAKKLADPSGLIVSRPSRGPEILLNWTDNADGETGYEVLSMNPETREQATIATLDANTTTYTITSGLTYGNNYYFGVRAIAAKEVNNSTTLWSIFYYADISKQPVPTFEGEAKCYPTCITVSYYLDNMGTQRRTAWGLCWADHPSPTIKDNWCNGPKMQTNTTPITQVITNPSLEYGKRYYIRAYVTVESGTYYSDNDLEAELKAEPEAITFNWKEESISGLPSSVKVYSTTDKLSGHNFNAWYAVADMTQGDVEFRVQNPAGLKSVKDQCGSNCYVLVNGGYFGSNGDYSYLVVNGVTVKPSIGASRGSLRSEDAEYNVMYNCTKGVYGTDKDGKPSALWGSTGADGNIHFFDSPMPTVKGGDKYDAATSVYPMKETSWSPKYALTSGPVLVKNGNIIIEPTQTRVDGDFYLTNYEIIAYDIFGASVSPDRTAVGTKADGSIVLFICDGRISKSGGATVFELARIMKGLGCVDAVNFDGGGSTAMVVSGKQQLNYVNGDDGGRKVSSTMGFFKK